ncbi:quinone oxidoreductase, putative, partial [Ixodes scapularis]
MFLFEINVPRWPRSAQRCTNWMPITRAAASMSVMRAVQVNKFGGPQVLQECNVPIPKVTPGKVLVRVKAAGVNPIDTYIREGTFPVSFQLPYTPGKDGAGLVEEVGQGDTSLKARCNV